MYDVELGNITVPDTLDVGVMHSVISQTSACYL